MATKGSEESIIDVLEANDPTLKDAPKVDEGEGGTNEADTSAQAVEGQNQQQQQDQAGTQRDNTVDNRGRKQDGDRQQQTQQTKALPNGATQLPNGSLKLQDGTIIQAGAHRRLFEQKAVVEGELTTTKQHNEQLANALAHIRDNVAPEFDRVTTQLRAENEALKTASTMGNQLQLSPDEQVYGLKLVAAYKKDPLGTIQHILAEAKAAGHNIEGIGSAVDMAAINRSMDARLAPLTAQHERAQQEQQAFDSAGQELATFYRGKPDAKLHEEHIANLLERDPNLSLESAYYELKLAATQRGLDWSKPLAEQINATAGASAQTGRTQGNGGGQQQQQQQVTLPNGRPNASANSADKPIVYSGNAEWTDMIRDSMREAGLRV